MKLFLVIVSALFLFSSCLKGSDGCAYDPCAITAESAEITELESWLASSAITATKHCSGVYYTIEDPGTGTTAGVCSYISVKYKAQLTNGNIFDESTTPVGFRLGNLIESWKKAIPLIKAGGKIKIYSPPSLGYGSQERRDANGNVIIPANSILVFEVELVSVS